jgi:ligand-binding sensor domain-containing protein/DNA-binding CsgD family transcriptional regulator
MPKNFTISILFALIFGLGSLCHNKMMAQNMTSIPMVKNYPKQNYNGGTQTWDICESDNGLVFFANNDGLLIFDGKQYSRHALPKNTILRSVYYHNSSKRIYVGGQNELGYFIFEKNGSLRFESLALLLPADFKGFEDVWSIEEENNKIYFQTSRYIFAYDGQKMSLQSPSANLLECMFKVGSRLLLTDINGSIFELKSNQFKAIIADTKLDISSLLPSGKNDLLITTYKNGIYFLRGNALVKSNKDESPLKNNRIYRACTYGNYYVLASNRAGIYFLDSSGRIVNNISIKGGLQNNNVLSLFKDRNNNVWLGLDNGIDLVRLNYPFGYLLPDGLLKGTGYTMTEFNNYYYFGTNNGLYCRAKYNNNSDAFQLVSNTEGQVWNTQVINSKLFVCHHEGLFEVNGLIANKISDTRGCWKIIKDEKKPGNFIMGTYDGLSIFKWENNSLVLSNKLARFKESSRFLEQDETGNLWVGHPYKGLYKIKLEDDMQGIKQVRLYGTKDGLPNETENYVFSNDMGVCFATEKGIYKYRSDIDKFELSKTFAPLLDSSIAYKRIINGKNGNIWFISSQEMGYLKPSYNGVDYTYSKVKLPKLDQNLVGGFEFLNECSDGNLFIGVESGFVNIDLLQIKKFKQQAPSVLITSVNSLSVIDSVYYKYLNSSSAEVEINDRSVEFSFSSPNAYFYKDVVFSSYLEGWDKSWSAWKTSSTREFSRLSYGEYTLRVKAKCMSLEGPETLIKIHIPAPWFWTPLAKVFYSILALLAVLVIGFYPQMLVRKKASRVIAAKDDHFKQQTEQLRLEKEKQEKELIELKNQQLQKELEHQGKELASSTMHIVQKSEKLLSIKEKLKRISQISNDPKIKPEISELIKDIDKDTLIDKDWEKFELYFNNIHESFTQSLKAKFPVLSANDIKMCAYLRMNLSTKEIASILNISVRGVEISRYRLRKKMELDNGTNLTDYLSRL